MAEDGEVSGADINRGWKGVVKKGKILKGAGEGEKEEEEKKDADAGKKDDGNRQLSLGFEIQVAELPPHTHTPTPSPENAASTQTQQPIHSVPITLDPALHQAYTWATEDDIRKDRYVFSTPEVRAMILRAFV